MLSRWNKSILNLDFSFDDTCLCNRLLSFLRCRCCCIPCYPVFSWPSSPINLRFGLLDNFFNFLGGDHLFGCWCLLGLVSFCWLLALSTTRCSLGGSFLLNHGRFILSFRRFCIIFSGRGLFWIFVPALNWFLSGLSLFSAFGVFRQI